MEWDYFISHASEDKLAIAAPLAKYSAEGLTSGKMRKTDFVPCWKVGLR